MIMFRTATVLLALTAAAACGSPGDAATPSATTLVSSTPATVQPSEPAQDISQDQDSIAEPTPATIDLAIAGTQFSYAGLDITVEEAEVTNEIWDGYIAEDQFKLDLVVVIHNPYDEGVNLDPAQIVLPDSTTTGLAGVYIDAGATSRETLSTEAVTLQDVGFDADLAGAMTWFADSTIIFGPEVVPLSVGLDGTLGDQPVEASNDLATAVVRDEGMNDPEGGDLVEFAFGDFTVSPNQIERMTYIYGGATRAENGYRYVAVDATVSDVATIFGGSNVDSKSVRLVVDGVQVDVLTGPNEISADGNSFEATWLFYSPVATSSVELHIYQARGDAKEAPTAVITLDPTIFDTASANPVVNVDQRSTDTRIS